MKYMKYGLLMFIVTVVYTVAASGSHYSFFNYTFDGLGETIRINDVTKTETSTQYVENYATSQAKVHARVYHSNGDYTGLMGVDVGETNYFKTSVNTSIVSSPGVYDIELTKNYTITGDKTIGGAWWLDESYYIATRP